MAKDAKKRDGQQHAGGSGGKPPGETNFSGTNKNQPGPSKDVRPPDASPKSKRKLAAQKLKEFEHQQKGGGADSDHGFESESETEDQRRKRIADEVKDQEAALLHAK
jgi:hypothetical protein